MKIRELWNKIDDKLRPVHVKGEDVNEAFIRSSEGTPISPHTYISSEQDEKPH